MARVVTKAQAAREKAAKNQPNEVIATQKAILKKLDTPRDTSTKVQAIAKLAYDKADAALQVANNQSGLVQQLEALIRTIEPTKVNGYNMKVNRNSEGFISSIDVSIK